MEISKYIHKLVFEEPTQSISFSQALRICFIVIIYPLSMLQGVVMCLN